MSNGRYAAKSDQLEANKALVRRVYPEWWNAKGNIGSVDEMVRPDFVGYLGGGKIRNIESLKNDIIVYQGRCSMCVTCFSQNMAAWIGEARYQSCTGPAAPRVRA